MNSTSSETRTIVQDFLGKEIAEGSKIVYPGRSGSDMWMNQGVVLAVNVKAPDALGRQNASLRVETTDLNGEPKLVTIERVDRVTVVS